MHCVAQVSAEESSWVAQLLDYYTAILERGEAVPPDADFSDSVQQPPIPAEVYAAILSGTQLQHPHSSTICPMSHHTQCPRSL